MQSTTLYIVDFRRFICFALEKQAGLPSRRTRDGFCDPLPGNQRHQ
jgi:hypothetical protein